MKIRHWSRDKAESEFVKSLKKTDREFINDLVKEWERQEGQRK
jgi:hypothetical protein